MGKTSPTLSLPRRGTRLSWSLSFPGRSAAGGEVERDVKTPLLKLDEVDQQLERSLSGMDNDLSRTTVFLMRMGF
jgi:hypothetical protein